MSTYAYERCTKEFIVRATDYVAKERRWVTFACKCVKSVTVSNELLRRARQDLSILYESMWDTYWLETDSWDKVDRLLLQLHLDRWLWEFYQVRSGRTAVDWLPVADALIQLVSQSVVTPLSSLPSSTTLFFKLYLLILLTLLLSKLGKDEEPGLLRLINPVKREGKPDLTDIELWPRCVPEGMIFKVTLIPILS